LPAFATAACPWFYREHVHFRIARAGAEGMTLRAVRPQVALLDGMELEVALHLVFGAVERVRVRVTAVRRPHIAVVFLDPPCAVHRVLANYLLATDATLTPALLRASGLAVGSIEQAVSYDYATSAADLEEILALRLRAHRARGHLEAASVADLRSPFDAHSRHLTCRFAGRIVGYVRVIFVDGSPERSQYVSWGGHEVPQWLWDAGFVEAGAGAMDPDFQRAGLFVRLMAHAVRVAVQSGHRYVLGACDDALLAMYRELGFSVLEERIVEPKPDWRFRSHLLVLDAERLADDTPALAALASAVDFAAAA
jgi:GNAT superfamily N-acetyltransferase